ncbi:SDR family NAD(P)-dependent oxidoreductase [Flagellimonas sp. 2504JD1-5]
MEQKAIIVGASSGIGRELALTLAHSGFKVGVTGRREELLDQLANDYPNSFIPKAFDCTKENVIENLETLVENLGGLDLFIFSSGTGDLNESLDDGIEQMTNNLNVLAFSKILGWAFRFFQKQGFGHLAAISSIGGLRGSGIAPSYNASKAYQINYLEGLRQKAVKSKLKITVTDIRPGFVDTAMAKGDGKFWVAPPKKAAKQMYSALQRKKDKVYVTKRWRIIALILKILPTWLYKRM